MNAERARHRLRELVATIDYKPGWELTVPEPASIREYHQPLVTLRVTAQVPNIYNPTETVQVGRTQAIMCDPWDRDRVLDQVRHLVVGLELHEVDEWLTVDGKHVRDPHPDTDDHQAPTRRPVTPAPPLDGGWQP